MKYLEIINFKYDDLKEYLNKPSIQEDDYLEWKRYLNLENDRLRKLFSAFANTNGGCIFFGIGNNKEILEIKGGDPFNSCEENNSLLEFVILSSTLKPSETLKPEYIWVLL